MKIAKILKYLDIDFPETRPITQKDIDLLKTTGRTARDYLGKNTTDEEVREKYKILYIPLP